MTKQCIRVFFVDFWPGFSLTDNVFVNLLKPIYDVQISDNPDFLFYSVFGTLHKKYRCLKIFYTGECVPPNFEECDYAFTFEYLDDPRHYRLPIYAFYDLDALTAPKLGIENLRAIKTEFCGDLTPVSVH